MCVVLPPGTKRGEEARRTSGTDGDCIGACVGSEPREGNETSPSGITVMAGDVPPLPWGLGAGVPGADVVGTAFEEGAGSPDGTLSGRRAKPREVAADMAPSPFVVGSAWPDDDG